MKKIIKLSLCVAAALCVMTFKVGAATSERLVTFALTGFFQETNSLGDGIAIPFRITTKDILVEISLETGFDFTNGVLVAADDDIDSTNDFEQFVVRKALNELIVTDFFDVQKSEDVNTTRFAGDIFKSVTFYAIDQFQFSTLVDTNDFDGLELNLQVFSKETLTASTRTIGSTRRSVISASLKSDGNGEFFSGNGFIGPIKGNIKIGTPRFFP